MKSNDPHKHAIVLVLLWIIHGTPHYKGSGGGQCTKVALRILFKIVNWRLALKFSTYIGHGCIHRGKRTSGSDLALPNACTSLSVLFPLYVV